MGGQRIDKVALSPSIEVIRELDKRGEASFGNWRGKRSLYVEMLLRNEFHMNAAIEQLKALEKKAEE